MDHFKTYNQYINENYDENYDKVSDKSELLGKKMYHGTILGDWEVKDEDSYLFLTDDIELAKYFGIGRAEGRVFSEYSDKRGEPCTGIVYEITINENIINLNWEPDSDYEWMKTWQDSYNEIGRFVISGNLNIIKFKEVYREIITSESEVRYDY